MKRKNPVTASETQVTATIYERAKVYGDPYTSHQNIGLAWTGLLQQHFGIKLEHPVPASLVALMMCNFKSSRSCRVFHADNYVDQHAYARFAEEFQQRERLEQADTTLVLRRNRSNRKKNRPTRKFSTKF